VIVSAAPTFWNACARHAPATADFSLWVSPVDMRQRTSFDATHGGSEADAECAPMVPDGGESRTRRWWQRCALRPGPRAVALILAATMLALVLERRGKLALSAVKFTWSRMVRGEICRPGPDGRLRAPDVERKNYTFLPEVRWPGDEAFYRLLPCPRSSYRVVIPAALAGGTPPADCGGPTIVSAFFDIGRAQWKGVFKRTADTYLAEARRVTLTQRNRMVFFTSPDLVDRVVAERAALGLADRTIVVGMGHTCVPTSELYDEAAAAMCHPAAMDGFFITDAPEQRYPWWVRGAAESAASVSREVRALDVECGNGETGDASSPVFRARRYNILMWAKIHFLAAATTLPQVASDYYYWLDAGCHYPM
jgi:hypothetical protein